MNELKVIKQVAPVIEINFDEVKAGLEANLSKYEGIVVTDETLSDCTSMQKELSSVRREIDGKRLDIQREAKKPLDAFNAQMKELMSLVISVEDPIKAGMQVFEDERIRAKTDLVAGIMADSFAVSSLREEYYGDVPTDPRWMNKGASITHITTEILASIDYVLAIQNIHDENAAAIRGVVKSTNDGLTTPLDAEYYVKQLDHGSALSGILGSITADARRQKEAEEKAVQASEDKKQALTPPAQESSTTDEPPQNSEPSVRTITLKVTATDEKFKLLGSFLKTERIAYEKIEG